jgi:melanoma-associated antigen
LVKNFVKYAFACEFTRSPLRRDEISKKGSSCKGGEVDVVLEGKYAKWFSEVFRETNVMLEKVFRMTLIELPAKEKHQTVMQKRKSMPTKQGVQLMIGVHTRAGPGVKSWIMKSTFPDHIATLPSLQSENEPDAIYQGLVAVIVSLIYLNNGVLAEGLRPPFPTLT